MRPVLLDLAGFTSFRERQELNFEGLDLFAISGPTGSGKSSILDAITYALYGRVERVGREVGQLVSQGRAKMSVGFVFSVGDDRYRITRATPASGGSTKVLLEQLRDGEWVQAGDGADRVGLVNARIQDLVGLDYDGFTRSVLLPQGKFAEFLVGEASKRREILTELLGLRLFRDMAQRAGTIARDADQQATAHSSLIEREYEGVDDEALTAACERADAARAREESIEKASERVADIADRWEHERRAHEKVRVCVGELDRVAEQLDTSAVVISRASSRLDEAAPVLGRLARAHQAAGEAAEAASAARARAEEESGGMRALAAARGAAETLSASRARMQGAQRARATAVDRIPALDRAVAAAAQEVARATDARAVAETAIEEAHAVLDAARRADLAAALCDGLHPGDACPVCGGTLEHLPSPEAALTLAGAQAADKSAAAKLKSAEGGVVAAERALRDAERNRADLDAEIAQIDREMMSLADVNATASSALAPILGEPLPEDPVGAVEERIEILDAASALETQAKETLATAAGRLTDADRRHAAIEAEVLAERAAMLARDPGAVLARAGELGAAVADPEPAPMGAADLAIWARDVVARARIVREGLGDVAAQAERSRAALCAEAEAAAAGLVQATGSVEGIARALAAEVRKAAGDAATAQAHADSVRRRLATRNEMAQDVERLGARAQAFQALATELRADRLIAFLQNEALQVLCGAGTAHLAALSDGRYRLVSEDDEFHVVDVWNGEDRRSVKTLSGGETFLASLALALALSEHVQALSMLQTARLDSLFLDEGFGTLDSESLEQVVQAIEQIGGTGRTVGVITHISDLAERLPSRIIIEKSPQGSRVITQQDQ
ncbi:MAG: SMC family ATPase [Actinomycetota bacterium]